LLAGQQFLGNFFAVPQDFSFVGSEPTVLATLVFNKVTKGQLNYAEKTCHSPMQRSVRVV
jgi:hypothetical protein